MRAPPTAVRLPAAILLLALAGCREPDGPAPNQPSPLAHRNVIVIDDGIDVTAADLQQKVVAAFTVVCAPGTEGDLEGLPGAGNAGATSFADVKSAYIVALGVADQSCSIRSGIDPRPNPLTGVERHRARWNAMIRGQKVPTQVFSQREVDELDAAIDPARSAFPFHGTATATTIAHANPDVRLVLIERPLGDLSTEVERFVCLTQAKLDLATALLSDADVRDAYAHAPPSRYREQLLDIVNTFNVGLVNESFGSLTRATIEMLQEMKGCPAIDARAYFSLLHDVNVARLAVRGSPYLAIVSAGNDSQEITSGSDTPDCLPEDTRRILVGSTDLEGGRSGFSNFGDCVNAFAPGEDVIAAYAGGWLFAVQGTSISTPLVTRHISLHAREPFDAAAARADFLTSLPTDRRLPVSAVPRDFFYAPGQRLKFDGLTVRDQSSSALFVGSKIVPSEKAGGSVVLKKSVTRPLGLAEPTPTPRGATTGVDARKTSPGPP